MKLPTMNPIYKGLALIALSLIAAAFSAMSALAYYPSHPWTYAGGSQASIGTHWQETSIISYDYGFAYGRHYYSYVAPARAGGFYGSGIEYVTGLRAPVYAPVPPVRYAQYYQPACTWPTCFLGAAGYPRAHASQVPLSVTVGGIYG